MSVLETVERLADLHIKRALLGELEQKAWNLAQNPRAQSAISNVYDTYRRKARTYRRACRVLFEEIKRLETLLDAEFAHADKEL